MSQAAAGDVGASSSHTTMVTITTLIFLLMDSWSPCLQSFSFRHDMLCVREESVVERENGEEGNERVRGSG